MTMPDDGLHRRLLHYAGQTLPAYLQSSEPAPERDPLLHDMTLPEVHGRISPLNLNRTRPGLPTQGFGSYLAQFTSTTALLEHVTPGMATYNLHLPPNPREPKP